MSIIENYEGLIGKTPLYHAKNVEKKYSCFSRLLLKIESFNPAGSIKDRATFTMVREALNSGLIKEGATIIEPTSGNTGIALASIGANLGFKVKIVMPDTMSEERIKLIKAYGAEVVLTDGKGGMQGAIEKAKEINQSIPNSIILSQFDNPNNWLSHYQTTGPEIWKDTAGKVDIVVMGIGTGGTLSGVAKYLKEQNPNVKIIGVEPLSSPLISKGIFSGHKIQGIGANFIPHNFDAKLCDEILTVSDEQAYVTTNMLAKTEGLLVGISSGASLHVGIKIAKEVKNKTVVVILPDTGDRYLSVNGLFD